MPGGRCFLSTERVFCAGRSKGGGPRGVYISAIYNVETSRGSPVYYEYRAPNVECTVYPQTIQHSRAVGVAEGGGTTQTLHPTPPPPTCFAVVTKSKRIWPQCRPSTQRLTKLRYHIILQTRTSRETNCCTRTSAAQDKKHNDKAAVNTESGHFTSPATKETCHSMSKPITSGRAARIARAALSAASNDCFVYPRRSEGRRGKKGLQ